MCTISLTLKCQWYPSISFKPKIGISKKIFFFVLIHLNKSNIYFLWFNTIKKHRAYFITISCSSWNSFFPLFEITPYWEENGSHAHPCSRHMSSFTQVKHRPGYNWLRPPSLHDELLTIHSNTRNRKETRGLLHSPCSYWTHADTQTHTCAAPCYSHTRPRRAPLRASLMSCGPSTKAAAGREAGGGWAWGRAAGAAQTPRFRARLPPGLPNKMFPKFPWSAFD